MLEVRDRMILLSGKTTENFRKKCFASSCKSGKRAAVCGAGCNAGRRTNNKEVNG